MAETPRKDHWSSLLESIGLATATPQKPAAETASEIAAEVPPAAAPIPAATPPEVPAAESAPAAEAAKPAAKKPAKTSGHWGKLAGMLGLSVAQPEPEPEPEPAPQPPAPTPVAAVPNPLAEMRAAPSVANDLPPDLFAPPARAEVESRPAPRDRERSDRSERERGRGRDEHRDSRPAEGRRDSRDTERSSGERAGSDRGGSDRGGRGDRGRGRDDRRDSENRPPRRDNPPARRGFGEGVSEDWQPETHSQPAYEQEPAAEHFDDDFVAPREPSLDSPADEERLGFDRPADEEGERRPRRRRRRRGGRRDEEEATPRAARPVDDFDAPASEPFVDEPYAAEAYADADDDFHAELPPVDEDVAADDDRPARRAPGDSEGGEDRGPRRRRRRRRGGRRDEGAEAPRSAPASRPAPAARNAADDDSDLEDDFAEVEEVRPTPSAARGRPQRDSRRAPTEDDEVDEMLQAELDEDGGEGVAHKKIPTWQETVGVLIDGNMSMRSERPETRGGRGRRPPHRGR